MTRLAGLLVLCVLAGTLLPNAIAAARTAPLTVSHIALPAGVCLAGSLAFIGLRALLLRRSVQIAARQSAACSLLTSVRGFCEGACVEAISWPGKLWADAYRQWLLLPLPLTTRVTALVLFRVGTALGSVLLLGLAACASATDERWGVAAPLALAGAILALVLLNRSHSAVVGLPVAQLTTLPALALAGALADVVATAVAAHLLTGVPVLTLVPLLVLIGVAGAVSTLPLGVGVVDVGLWWVLTAQCNVHPGVAATTILVTRTCGPGLTLMLGAGSMLHRWVLRASVPGRAPTASSTLAAAAQDDVECLSHQRGRADHGPSVVVAPPLRVTTSPSDAPYQHAA